MSAWTVVLLVVLGWVVLSVPLALLVGRGIALGDSVVEYPVAPEVAAPDEIALPEPAAPPRVWTPPVPNVAPASGARSADAAAAPLSVS